MRTQSRSRRKPTGGLYHKFGKKKVHEFGSDQILVKLEKEKYRVVRTRGGSRKRQLLQTNKAVIFPGGKIAKIITVKENPANPHFVRMNIITKGAIIETELGLAKVVSRPTQHGVVNAVLIEEKKGK